MTAAEAPIHRSARALGRGLAACVALALAARADHLHVAAGQLEGLIAPVDAQTDGAGLWFVLDREQALVLVYDEEGQRLRSFGGRGSGAGELLAPEGLALALDGRVFVADTGNDRVQVFDAEGRPAGGFGQGGAAPGELRRPAGLAVHGERVYVADTANDRVQVFDTSGRALFVVGAPGREDGELERPADVAVDVRGQLYVSDRRNHRIVKFDEHGGFVASFGGFGAYPGLLRDPGGLEWRDGRLFVADRGNDRIQAFDAQGRLRYLFGRAMQTAGEAGGALHGPSALAVDPAAARALVCEPRAARAQWFVEGADKDAVPHAEHAQGSGLASYKGPIALAGRQLAVVDEAEACVLVFDVAFLEPRSVSRLGGYGRERARFVEPTDVAIDAASDLVWVADAGQRRLSAFRVAHEPREAHVFDPLLARFVKALDLDVLAAGPLAGLTWPFEPRALACGAEGRLFVADARNGRLAVIAPDLALEALWPVRLDEPLDLAWDPESGRLAVAERGRVRFFDARGEAAGELALSAEDWAACGGAGAWRPAALSFAPSGELFCAGGARGRLQVFAEGRLERSIGESAGVAAFAEAAGLACGPDGHVYLVDPGLRRGQVMGPDGRFLLAF